jgi:hypothetical protein
MDEAMVQAGWDFMDYVAGDCVFESEFKCEQCGEDMDEESEDGLCDWCHEAKLEMEEK